MTDFDYIVIGAGSAGCVLAARLSEDRNCSVLLLEAGGDERGLLTRMPAGTFKLMGNPRYDWGYESQPDPSLLGNRTLQFNAGRMLGGSSSINGMVYIRGTREDYARWAEYCPGWDFDSVLPYFRRAERFLEKDHPAHGTDGPLAVSYPGVFHPLAQAFMTACEDIGLRRLDDYCGGNQSGTFRVLGTMARGRRISTARAYLDPIRKRRNLTILTNADVERIIFTGHKAIGASAIISGTRQQFVARREVLVSAGAIGSPLLLQRSGIGNSEDLQAAGIPPVYVLPGVGRNLRDHAAVNISKFVDIPTYNVQTSPLPMTRALLHYALHGKGMLTTTAVQAMALAKTLPILGEPDITLHFVPVLTDFRNARPAMHARAGAKIGVSLNHPQARGQVRISGTGVRDVPVIEHRLLENEHDLNTLVRGVQLIEQLYACPSLSRHLLANHRPDVVPTSEEGWREFVRTFAHTGYHPIGTCRMGSEQDLEAVTDGTCRVWGVEALRVVDASVIPMPLSANTNAATIMLAERIADAILNKSSLK